MARQILTIAAYWSDVDEDWEPGEPSRVADECAELLRDSKETMRIAIGSVVTFRSETVDAPFRRNLHEFDLGEVADHRPPE